MAENTSAGTPAGNEAARPPAIGEAGFVPQPHAEDAELAALEAEANAAPAEQPAADQPTGATPPAETQTAAADDEPEGDQPRGKDGKWIPKARFDEQVAREREKGNLAAVAAFYKGKAEALEAAAKGGKPAEQAPTPEQEVAAIEDAILAKATDFDEGRIGMAEFKRFERQAQARLDTLRAPPPAARDEAPSDMRLQELTLALPERYPVLTQLTADHVHRLQPVAEAELQFEGVAVDGSPRSIYALRERIAQLAQARFGTAAQQTPVAATRPANVNKAVTDKLALAGRMPPNLNKTGTAQVPQDRFSAESIEKMDLDEIATAVPDSILRQLSGQ